MHGRLRLSSAALVLANLVPLAGVLWLGWRVSSVIILYWFENVVIGLFNVARMIAFSPADGFAAGVLGAGRLPGAQALGRFAKGAMARGAKLVVIPFFVVHYFMFCAGHGVFVFSLFPDENGFFPEQSGLELLGTLRRAIEIFWTPLAVAAAALALSHLVSFCVNYLGGGEYRRLDLQRLMMLPYGRIVVLHLTIIFGGFATMALGEPAWLLIVFIALKVGVDLTMHFKEHGNTASERAGMGPAGRAPQRRSEA